MRFTSTALVRNDLLEAITTNTKNPLELPNAIMVTKHLPFLVGPHASVLRTAYTVPANKKAILLSTNGIIQRSVIATAISTVQIEFRLSHNGAGFKSIDIINFYDNTLYGSIKNLDITKYNLIAGDVLEINSFDISTGGQNLITLGYNLVEYDA